MATRENLLSTSYDEPILSKHPVNILVYTLTFSLFIFSLWYAFTSSFSTKQFAIIVLGVHLFLWGIIQATESDRSSLRGKFVAIAYTTYAIVSVIPTAYFAVYYKEVARRPGIFTQNDIVMGAILLGLILLAAIFVSRMVAAVSIFGIIYAYFGNYFPGFLAHGGLSVRRIITMNTAEMSGIYGDFLVIGATWILMFMFIAGLLESYGGMALIVGGASKLIRKSKYLRLGQVGVLASMAMGSINGSIAANVATTGSFTIPLMKSNDYPSSFAGAIESVASSGGQILPPIMGAAAFVMATFIQQSYGAIILAAVFPAILFYITVAFSIQINADKYDISEGIEGIPESEQEQSWFRILFHYDYIVSFIVLIYTLAYLQLSPMLAGLYTIITLIILRSVKSILEEFYFHTSNQSRKEAVTDFGRRTLEGPKRGVEISLDLLIMFVALSVMVRTFVVTGLSLRLSSNLIILSGGSLAILLVLSMIGSLLFGMAVSTTPAYLLSAILIAPALTSAGLQPLVAHFFVFMFAIAAGITPPIAVGVVVATGIAESDFLETALEAVKIGYPILLLPYAIVLNPQLLQFNLQTVPIFAVVLVALLSISVGITGYIASPVSIFLRGVYLVVGCLIIYIAGIQFLFGFGMAIFLVGLLMYQFPVGVNRNFLDVILFR